MALVVALIVLIIVHLITARISDAILDSQVGMIDRILGFIFGVLRGFFSLSSRTWPTRPSFHLTRTKQHPLVRDAFFRHYVKATGEAIRSSCCRSSRSPASAPVLGLPNEQPGQQGCLEQKGRSVALVIGGKRYYMTLT